MGEMHDAGGDLETIVEGKGTREDPDGEEKGEKKEEEGRMAREWDGGVENGEEEAGEVASFGLDVDGTGVESPLGKPPSLAKGAV